MYRRRRFGNLTLNGPISRSRAFLSIVGRGEKLPSRWQSGSSRQSPGDAARFDAQLSRETLFGRGKERWLWKTKGNSSQASECGSFSLLTRRAPPPPSSSSSLTVVAALRASVGSRSSTSGERERVRVAAREGGREWPIENMCVYMKFYCWPYYTPFMAANSVFEYARH